jgi:hypothetical protein
MICSPGTTSISLHVCFVDDTGLPLTGKAAADFPSIYYRITGQRLCVAFPALTNLDRKSIV